MVSVMSWLIAKGYSHAMTAQSMSIARTGNGYANAYLIAHIISLRRNEKQFSEL